ncbi:MAG: TRAP transporter substrate-binding protein [Pseudomonadota bacterium]
MNKTWMLLLAAIVLGLSGMTAPAMGAEFTLSYSNFFPPTHIQSKMAEAWAKEVETRTNDRVSIRYFPGQTLTKSANCFDGVLSGVSDLGMSALAYTRGRFPVLEVTDLPLGYRSGGEATFTANKVFEKIHPAELGEVEVMYLHAHGPGLLHTRKQAVRVLEDIKGLKIRSTGTSAVVVQALGGVPVAQPMPETYQLLQKGVVDGSFYPVESNQGWKLGEVVDYMTNCHQIGYSTGFFVVMNKQKWAGLPGDIQDVIREINQEWAVKTGRAWDESDQAGWDYLKARKVEVVELSEAEAAKWTAAVQPIFNDYLAKVKAKGLNGEEALAAARQALEEYRASETK